VVIAVYTSESVGFVLTGVHDVFALWALIPKAIRSFAFEFGGSVNPFFSSSKPRHNGKILEGQI
jgi:hypothetical protein